ncbi:MAG TPA: dihydrolipoyl dehydrogenase [Candidatus Binatia bacterium]|jgi:dihydrolipoamide dehydrogenase|nr:dihydrolipoyl dehydrogenase [Candidatus Binatia bacterium]
MKPREHDLIIIGAGPGGYVAALRAAQLGLDVGCVEKEAALGGTCLRIGCIPSKALLESTELFHKAKEKMAEHGIRLPQVEFDLAVMMRRKERSVDSLTKGLDTLFKRKGVTRYFGHGRIDAADRVVFRNEEGETELKARNILIATGSKPAGLPGVEMDGERIGTSTEALRYSEVPAHLVVIGAGAVGLELGSVWRRLGARVTVLEYLDRILPEMDGALAAEALKTFRKQGLEFRLKSRVQAARVEDGHCVIECDGSEPLSCDRVLVAVGRVPNTEGLGIEELGIKTDPRDRIQVDDRFRTTVAGNFAIGDVIRGPMLAHKAQEEGIACVEHLATGYGHVNYDAIPNVVYTQPEIAAVGKTEEELKEARIDFRRGIFPFRANGRAHTLGQTEGMIKVLAHAETDRILGVHVLGPQAAETIAEASTAIAFGASSEDLARSCHAHPTLSEALREAALAVAGRAIHI